MATVNSTAIAYWPVKRPRINAVKGKVTQIERARIIKRTLGVQVAARYMKLRGWSVEAALHVLVHP